MYSFTQAAENVEKKAGRRPPPGKFRVLSPVAGRTPAGLGSTSRTFERNLQDEAVLGALSFKELAEEGVALKVWSEVLGETILLVPNDYTPAEGDPVAYTHAEAEVLMSTDEDQIKAAHKLKKALRGRVIGKKEKESHE